MKLLLPFFILLLLSCTQNKPAPQQQNNIPEALEENKVDFSVTKRNSNDIIQNLYDEILKEDKELQKFEEGIEKINSGKPDSLEYYHSFLNKNDRYYNSAESYLSSIKDTVLKSRIQQLLSESNARFETGISRHKSLAVQIDTKEKQLADLHTAVKIIKTLSLMEKYQTDNRPSLNPLQKLNNDFNKLITKADSLTRK